jgi:hypothetical protein
VQGSASGDVYCTRGRPSGETAPATAATPTRRTRADPSHQGSAGIGGHDPFSRDQCWDWALVGPNPNTPARGETAERARWGDLRARLPARKRLRRRLWSKRERKDGWRTALPPRGEPGTNEAASFPEGLRRPIFRVPVVCKVIDPAASKLITQSAEHECGFLLNYRCALWTAFYARLTGSEARGQYNFAR